MLSVYCMKIILNSLSYNTGQHYMGVKKGGPIPHIDLFLLVQLQLGHSHQFGFIPN